MTWSQNFLCDFDVSPTTSSSPLLTGIGIASTRDVQNSTVISGSPSGFLCFLSSVVHVIILPVFLYPPVAPPSVLSGLSWPGISP